MSEIIGYLPHMGLAGGRAGGEDAPEASRIPIYDVLPVDAVEGALACLDGHIHVYVNDGAWVRLEGTA